MLQIVKENWILLGGLVSADCRSAVLLELLAFDAFRYSDVTRAVVNKLVYLQRDGEERKKKSALAKFNEKQLHLQSSVWLGTAENSFVKKCKYYVLYKPSVDNFPVADGFFFVEGHGTSGERVAMRTAHSCDAHQPKTIVLLQATKAKYHHTKTSKLLKLKAILRREFGDWADFSKNMRWEIVYVQDPDTRLFKKRQRCERTEVKKKKRMKKPTKSMTPGRLRLTTSKSFGRRKWTSTLRNLLIICSRRLSFALARSDVR
ncbi:hypothetical protein ERJ75_000530700 [Trypanosoma vivax]|uniref:Retrotransposon hot spot protein (RHS) n=1 Tax=Trypanosoma vivax (strain Y486) TaxID=1055687 RepID=F9WMW9_TRYVY|nr:hypothetical protein ERJ75_000532600 [Trypanosoma vivax]KAH8615896.1 hypothetical protein ERJ75_000530700 [Trypanosoma vivax]CCD18883.1 hypothetical protein, conserved in T. vivax [Trypanosoma vivax Y486]|eukprot:CCD18883.1 hypothetical protein, conserved in T. vivax [Trypanosoma vivax Y486]